MTAPPGAQEPAALEYQHNFAPPDSTERVARFHELYYYQRLWETTHWLGVPTYKCPLDMWIYQEILFQTRPDVVVECGTAFGGSALYLASIMDQMQGGRVLTIDIVRREGMPTHPRIEYMLGSTSETPTMEQARERIRPGERVMVILDSLHRRDHVFAELELFWPLVSPGCYLIVEDSNINGHPVYSDYPPDQGPGAFEAVEDFLALGRPFERDVSRERLLMTFNPGGYLRRL